jgi:hypothetical protein
MSDEQTKEEPGIVENSFDHMRAGYIGKMFEKVMGDEMTVKELQTACQALREQGVTEFTTQNVADLLETVTCGKAESRSSVNVDLER